MLTSRSCLFFIVLRAMFIFFGLKSMVKQLLDSGFFIKSYQDFLLLTVAPTSTLISQKPHLIIV